MKKDYRAESPEQLIAQLRYALRRAEDEAIRRTRLESPGPDREQRRGVRERAVQFAQRRLDEALANPEAHFAAYTRSMDEALARQEAVHQTNVRRNLAAVRAIRKEQERLWGTDA